MAEITLQELARALAAHALIVAHPQKLREFLAPEISEATAAFILAFARGESIPRPKPDLSDLGVGDP